MMKCVKHNAVMQKQLLPTYEHEDGIVLKDVEAMVCPVDNDFTFTEKQIEEVERRTEAIKVHLFTFKRKITISGRSLVINLPEDLARHMHLVKGTIAKLRPIDDKRFMVEVGRS